MKKTFILLALFFGVKLVAQPLGWQHKQTITVQENSNTLITDYQLKLTVNTQSLIAAMQMNANGDDIRFGKTCDGSTLFNYWIESGINTATTVIWVKIDTLQANATKTIFMFYGNSTAAAVSAIVGTFIGPHSSTDSVSGANSGGVTNSQRGFRFQPTQDLLVTHFGKNEPNGSTRYITLFDFSSQAVLAQNQVAGPSAQYAYGNIPNPLWLVNGTQYILEIFQGASDGYYFGAAPQIGQHLTYLDMRYCNSCTQNTFPTNSLGGMHYGYVDLWYFTKNETTPAPTYTVNSVSNLNVASSSTAICSGETATLTASGATTYSWNTSATTASILVTPSATSTYSVYEDGCTTFSTITLVVNTTPTIIANSSASVICSGQTAILSASGATTYSWNTSATTPSISASPIVNTTYTVTGTSNGCSTTETIALTVNTTPTVNTSSSATLICSGQNATLTANGAATYSWNTSATASAIVVNPTVSTTYTVTGTANGCSVAATITQNVSPCTNLADVTSSDKFYRIMPNPNTGEFIFEASNLTQQSILEVYNSVGQLVHKTEVANGNNYLNLKHLSNGLYYLNLKDKDNTPHKISFIKN